MSDTVDITGVVEGALVAALYNAASPGGAQSMGWLNWKPGNLSADEAQAVIVEGQWIDYLSGRALKIKLLGNVLSSYLYDREYGEGAAQRIVDGLRTQERPDASLT